MQSLHGHVLHVHPGLYYTKDFSFSTLHAHYGHRDYDDHEHDSNRFLELNS